MKKEEIDGRGEVGYRIILVDLRKEGNFINLPGVKKNTTKIYLRFSNDSKNKFNTSVVHFPNTWGFTQGICFPSNGTFVPIKNLNLYGRTEIYGPDHYTTGDDVVEIWIVTHLFKRYWNTFNELTKGQD